MSIANKLTRLNEIRSDMRQKLVAKGVEATDHNFADFPSDVESIPTGGGVQGDWLKIHSEEIVVGQNSISGSKDMVDYLKAAAAEFNEGNLFAFSVLGDPKVNRMYYYSLLDTYTPLSYGMRYSNNGLNKTVCNNNSYDGYLPADTRVALYIAEEVAY